LQQQIKKHNKFFKWLIDNWLEYGKND
jgi:hypothetical protein